MGVLPGKTFLSTPLYTSCVSLDSFFPFVSCYLATNYYTHVDLCFSVCSEEWNVLKWISSFPSSVYPAIRGSSVVRSNVPHILGVLIKICLALGGGVSLLIVAQLSHLLRLGL